jgi:hypothetical protein
MRGWITKYKVERAKRDEGSQLGRRNCPTPGCKGIFKCTPDEIK